MSYKLINLFQIILIFCTLLVLINSSFSEKRLCGNTKCSVIISTGKTTLKYTANQKHILSFNGNTAVRIFGKSLVTDLWEVEINGRRGYVSSKFIQEDKILFKKDKLITVPVDDLEHNQNFTTSTEENGKVVLKSSQKYNPDADDVSSTTTAPLTVNEIKNEINLDTNTNTELPSSSPVQKNIEVVDGTLIDKNDGTIIEKSIEIDSEDSDDEGDVENEDDDDVEYDENLEDIPQKEDVKIELDEKDNKKHDSKTLAPSKINEFYNLATKTENASNLNNSEPILNENSNNIESSITNDKEIKIKTEEHQERVENDDKSSTEKQEIILEETNITSQKSIESEIKTDKSAENNSSVEQIDLIENINEINETIPNPIKYYTVGAADIENTKSLDMKETKKINEFNEIKSTDYNQETVIASPKTGIEQDKTSDVIDIVSNNQMENDTIIDNNKEGNKTNIEEEKLIESAIIEKESKSEKSGEIEIKPIDVNPSEDNAENNITQNSYNNYEDVHAKTQDYVEKNIQHDVTKDVQSQQTNNTKNVEEEVHGKTQDYGGKNIPQDVNEDVQNNPQQQQQNSYHEFPPFFNNQQNNINNINEKEKTETQPELTTPNYEDSIYPDPYLDSTTANPKQQSVTENIPEVTNENNQKNLNDDSDLKSENYSPQTLNKDETVQDQPSQSLPIENKDETVQDQPSQNLPIESEGLFTTILNTVNNFLASSSFSQLNKQKEDSENDNELDTILYPNKDNPLLIDNKIKQLDKSDYVEDGFCENIGPNACPSNEKLIKSGSKNKNSFHCSSELDFFSSMSDKILDMFDVLVCLAIAAASSILFAFGYYCICNCRKERTLISKLNIVERSLLASYKEVAIVKHDLFETRNKLSSMQDNTFGSNDMVIALKNDIGEHIENNLKLREQIVNLEKELENAAEAGLELNKIVSDLLSSQNGDASIASSVEELQKQLNEQQKTIEEINTILGEKSRENSELNIFLNEQHANFQKELQELREKMEESENDKILLQSKLGEGQKEIRESLSKDLISKEKTIDTLKLELYLLQQKYDNILTKWQVNEARVEVLEEGINSTKKDSKFNMKEFMDVANLKVDILAIKRERNSLKERLEGEMDARKLLDDHVKIISEEVSALKIEYNQSEKEKLEAQTRLDVLTNYFKEKETQLQKEMSVKEAMWMKQQGETTSTVERVRTMQNEVQALKSQNDSLRAEIEAQSVAHKMQLSSLENRAHEAWLTSRQSERKFDEARAEAATLRRKLTALAANPTDINRLQNSVTDVLTTNSLNNAPSPIHLDSPSSPPLLSGLPIMPPFLPPPFMGAPLPPHPHFMGMPPPFMPPHEMRPPPLGRLMSPPPMQSSSNHNRYSPSILDDENDDDYEYELRHSRSVGGRYTPENNRRYSPDNCRNYSPDSRYNYATDLISTYDTETDFSPPPSPRRFRSTTNRYDDRSTPVDGRDERNSRVGNSSYKAFSPQPLQNSIRSPTSNSDIRNKSKSNKGLLSSGSEKSFDSRKSKGKMKV